MTERRSGRSMPIQSDHVRVFPAPRYQLKTILQKRMPMRSESYMNFIPRRDATEGRSRTKNRDAIPGDLRAGERSIRIPDRLDICPVIPGPFRSPLTSHNIYYVKSNLPAERMIHFYIPIILCWLRIADNTFVNNFSTTSTFRQRFRAQTRINVPCPDKGHWAGIIQAFLRVVGTDRNFLPKSSRKTNGSRIIKGKDASS